MSTHVQVECYSGYRANERPLQFVLGERTLEVVEVRDRWYSPHATWFRLLAGDGNTYILRHDEECDDWTLEAYRTGD